MKRVYILGRRVEVVSAETFSLYFIYDSGRIVSIHTRLREAIKAADDHYRKVM